MTDRRIDTSLYDDYAQWKDWSASSFMEPSSDETAAYDAEISAYDMRGKSVLDIGFGNGGFLAYAKSRGVARLAGSETQLPLCDRARDCDVDLVDLDFARPPKNDPQFDLITAWDVAEHLERPLLDGLFATVSSLLKDGGIFIARFPNGQSPLGRIHQHGDPTHLSILSAPIMAQLAAKHPLEVVRSGNPRLPSGAKRRLRRRIQLGYERALQLLYGTDAPLAPNTVIEYRRRER